MSSFLRQFLDTLAAPHELLQIIRQMGEHKGRQDFLRLQAPEKLENLRQVAVIQSIESSNRIEGTVGGVSERENDARRSVRRQDCWVSRCSSDHSRQCYVYSLYRKYRLAITSRLDAIRHRGGR